jgi:hypothetical protein
MKAHQWTQTEPVPFTYNPYNLNINIIKSEIKISRQRIGPISSIIHEYKYSVNSKEMISHVTQMTTKINK